MKTIEIFNAIIEKETEKAYLLTFDYGFKIFNNVWLPKSKVNIIKETPFIGTNSDMSEFVYKKYTLSIPYWLLANTKPTSHHNSGDCNSVWVSIFAKQDANGFSNNGYSLD